jgi:hypothetical protein
MLVLFSEAAECEAFEDVREREKKEGVGGASAPKSERDSERA